MKIKQLFNKLNDHSKKIVSYFFLNIMYFFGIGPTSIISKILGKRFLMTNSKKTNWVTFKQSKDLESMF